MCEIPLDTPGRITHSETGVDRPAPMLSHGCRLGLMRGRPCDQQPPSSPDLPGVYPLRTMLTGGRRTISGQIVAGRKRLAERLRIDEKSVRAGGKATPRAGTHAAAGVSHGKKRGGKCASELKIATLKSYAHNCTEGRRNQVDRGRAGGWSKRTMY